MGREAIKAALANTIGAALPDARLEGFDGAPAKPGAIGAGGLVELEGISDGGPRVDLNPFTYHKTARFDLVVAARTADSAGAMLAAIGAAIEADRTLGGASEWADADGGDFDDQTQAGSAGHCEVRITVSAEYTTTNPLD